MSPGAQRLVIALAVMVPIGSFALLGGLYWLVVAESVRVTFTALRVEDRRGA